MVLHMQTIKAQAQLRQGAVTTELTLFVREQDLPLLPAVKTWCDSRP